VNARSPRGWIPCWLLVALAAAISMTLRPVSLPAAAVGLRRFQVPINSEIAVSQTFAMTADGLRGVEFQPAAVGDAPSGTLRYELTEAGSGVVRQGELPVARALSAPTYTVEFAPIEDSKDAMFRFDLVSSPTEPASGIAVWATKGNRYSDGVLQINGRDRFGDLAFKALAPGGQSDWARLTAMQSPPPGVSSRTVILAALAAYMLLSALVLRAVSRMHN